MQKVMKKKMDTRHRTNISSKCIIFITVLLYCFLLLLLSYCTGHKKSHTVLLFFCIIDSSDNNKSLDIIL